MLRKAGKLVLSVMRADMQCAEDDVAHGSRFKLASSASDTFY